MYDKYLKLSTYQKEGKYVCKYQYTGMVATLQQIKNKGKESVDTPPAHNLKTVTQEK